MPLGARRSAVWSSGRHKINTGNENPLFSRLTLTSYSPHIRRILAAFCCYIVGALGRAVRNITDRRETFTRSNHWL